MTWTCSCVGRVVSASDATSVRTAVDLPDLGAPTIAACPPGPDRSTVNGSCRCSSGRSTRPIDAVSAGNVESTASASAVRAGSGGNHTRWAECRCPAIAATVASKTVRDGSAPDTDWCASSRDEPSSTTGPPAAVNAATRPTEATPTPCRPPAESSGTGPDTYAEWKRTGAPASVLRKPAPGVAGR